MKWVNFLHIYQPPTQTKEVVDQIVRESYSLLPELLRRHPQVRLTMNVTGSLLELLEKYGHGGVIQSLKKYVDEGRIELVGSAMYHPLLPLTSRDETKRQIMLNDMILAKHFGAGYARRGFFFPEMAYSPEAAAIVKEMDFEWIILDELHASPADNGGGAADPAVRYTDQASGLGVIFRNHEFSRSFPPEFIMGNLGRAGEYLVTAHDGELYGHWHKDDKGFYEKAFTSPQVQTMTVSEYFAESKDRQPIALRNASWESLEEELAVGNPYALWDSPGNEVHQKLWALAHAAEAAIAASQGDEHQEMALATFGKGLASCAWWWGSGKKLGPFSPVSWSPSEIEKGAVMLLEAVRTLKSAPAEARLKAESCFTAVHSTVWHIHWTTYAPK